MRLSVEQNIQMLREAELGLSHGHTVLQVCKKSRGDGADVFSLT